MINGFKSRLIALGILVLAVVSAGIPLGHTIRARAATTDATKLIGSGESWPEFTVRKLENDAFYAGAIGSLNPTYTAARGEDNAQLDLASGTVDFAAGSMPMSPANASLAAQHGITPTYVPYAEGSVAVVAAVVADAQHGFAPITDIHLSIGTIAKIFTHKIFNWYDPEILAQNPGKLLNSAAVPQIQTVVRRDSSATTTALVSAFLADPVARPVWQEYASTAGIPLDVAPDRWPADPSLDTAGVTSGSAGAMQAALNLDASGKPIVGGAPDHSLVYVAPRWASEYLAPPVAIADLESPARYVVPTPDAVRSAFASPGAVFDPAVGRWKIDYAKLTSAGAYPIPDPAYFIVPSTGAAAGKLGPIGSFVRFALSDTGQRDVADTGMVPLPADIRAAAVTTAAGLVPANPTGSTTTSSSTTTSPSTTTSTTRPKPASSSSVASTGTTLASGPLTARPAASSPVASTAVRPPTGALAVGGTALAASTLPLTGKAPPAELAATSVLLLVAGEVAWRLARRPGRGS